MTQLTHRQFLATLAPEDRATLTAKSNAKGLWHLGGHLGLIALLASYVATGAPLWGLAVWPLGIVLAFLFTLQHECTHKTPFATGWINEVAGHATGLILVQPFIWFRAFHMAHHKHTNDPDNDPELSESHPRGPRALIWHLSTIGYWAAKIRLLLINAKGPAPAPYISTGKRAAIRTEAVTYAALYAAILTAMATFAPVIFWIWLLPLVAGLPVLRLYLLAEHDRCAHVADMFANTRTTLTTRAINALAWNMPYHAEHHAWPMVPFYQLPTLHKATKPHLKSLTAGYTQFTKDTLATRL